MPETTLNIKRVGYYSNLQLTDSNDCIECYDAKFGTVIIGKVCAECLLKLAGFTVRCDFCLNYFKPDYVQMDGCLDCSDIMNNRSSHEENRDPGEEKVDAMIEEKDGERRYGGNG